MLTINYSDPNDKGKMFTFESVINLYIDDGDPLWRKKRNSLLDPKMKSIMMIVDRKHNIMFLILFGEPIDSKKD